MKVRELLFIATLYLLASCGASGPKFTPAETQVPGKTLIYVYRSPTYAGIINWEVPFLKLNGEIVGRMRIGGYLPLVVDPGLHTITTTESSLGKDTGNTRGEIKMMIYAGETIYLKYSEHFKDYFVLPNGTIHLPPGGNFQFQYMPEEQGLIEISETELLKQ